MTVFVHPCVTCGACCVSFRVFFHWSETLPESFEVPLGSCESASPHLNVMKGTNQPDPRCEQLEGRVGEQVGCAIYENRPGPCRNLQASFEDGVHHSRCDDARIKQGLKVLTEQNWLGRNTV